MHFVSLIIIINLACVYSYWNHFISPTDHHFNDLRNNIDISPSDPSNVTTHTIDMPLDQFNSSDDRKIRIQYKQNLDLWQPNGPIYIYPYRGWFMQQRWLIGTNNNFVFAMAKETNGAMFIIQERYFIPSAPEINSTQEYYNYLSTAQQLADIAEFIKYLKSKPEFQPSKVVLIGDLWSGAHVAWMRAVYPNLVDAAVAISAPILAKKDVKELYEFTADLYERYAGEDCIYKIDARVKVFTDALKNKTALDIYKVKNDICEWDNFTVLEDIELYADSRNFYYAYEVTAMIGDLKRIKECKTLNHDKDSFIKRKLRACYEFVYSDFIEFMKRVKLPYVYQACTEYGQFDTTSAEKRPFVRYLPINFRLLFCKDVWGIDEKRMDEGIAQTNLVYGGLTPNVTNVVFTQGELNPLKLLGRQENLSDSAPAFVVKEDGMFNIMYYGKNESQNRIEVRNRVKMLIKKWIGLQTANTQG